MKEFDNVQLNLLSINTPIRDDYQLSEKASGRVIMLMFTIQRILFKRMVEILFLLVQDKVILTQVAKDGVNMAQLIELLIMHKTFQLIILKA
jgi:hypothetical protein